MGNFFLKSPGVNIREMDETTTIIDVSSNTAVNVLRQTYKGPEYQKIPINNEAELIKIFGKPTERSYKDILPSTGYLKYGGTL